MWELPPEIGLSAYGTDILLRPPANRVQDPLHLQFTQQPIIPVLSEEQMFAPEELSALLIQQVPQQEPRPRADRFIPGIGQPVLDSEPGLSWQDPVKLSARQWLLRGFTDTGEQQLSDAVHLFQLRETSLFIQPLIAEVISEDQISAPEGQLI